MNGFSYTISTHIEFGVDAIEQLPASLINQGFGRRLMMVTDAGLVDAGIAGRVLDILQQEGFSVTLFDEVQPNPRDTDCLAGAKLYTARWCDGIVALGGGSAMDTAKTIALLARHGGTPQQYADGERPYGDVPPVACVPTTAGTGSEVTRSAVITEAETHRKMTLKHEGLRPRFALLDPALTLSVPATITAATGVDALVHAIEGFTCKRTQPISQAFGLQAMPLIFNALPKAYANPNDIQARSDMLLGSLLAGLCFGAADVAAVHCLAEALGGLYDTPHGLANAVFLLPVLRYNVETDVKLYARIARNIDTGAAGLSDDAAVSRFLDLLEGWLQNLAIPALVQLRGVKSSDNSRIVELAMANSSTESNSRPMSPEAYEAILQAAYTGGSTTTDSA